MTLLNAQDLSKAFSTGPLFENINLTIAEDERLAIIGPNGSGKSTLLKILANLEEPDHGQVQRRRGVVCSYVAQHDEFNDELTIVEVLQQVLADTTLDQREIDRRISIAVGLAAFENKFQKVAQLSGGWRKRLAIIRGLITEPQVLLLDEPTNHLDISGIAWLEKVLQELACAQVFISHDRIFIESLAKRVFEINRAFPRGYYSSAGGYADYTEARENYWSGLQSTKQSLANKVRREVAWLRQGAKARTGKSKHRTEQAGKLIDELQNLKLANKSANIEFAASQKKSKELIKLVKVSKGFAGQSLFKDISIVITAGVKLGIVGNNGSGKTTLIKTLLGQIQPDSGQVIKANNLKISFFDQSRKMLSEELTLKEALCPAGDAVVFNEQSIHVATWAKRFLFSVDQLAIPIKLLSGGERARVLLARMMLEAADVIVFDEPTNDLDIDTLEILEECFREYTGALVLVTHDRYFLDQSTNIVIGLTPQGAAIYGDYQQWEQDLKSQKNTDKPIKTTVTPSIPLEKPKTKLGYLEQRELSGMEAKIIKAESKLAELQAQLDSQTQANDAPALTKLCHDLDNQRKEIETLYARWEELSIK